MLGFPFLEWLKVCMGHVTHVVESERQENWLGSGLAVIKSLARQNASHST